jgi:hypothetical protein
MTALADFQLAFAAALDRAPAPGDRLEQQPGFAVYRNTTPGALIETLRGHYPVCAEILGEEAFEAVAFGFARSHPPVDPILLRYGGAFAGFLERQDWIGELSYLPDVARVERLRGESHLAADAEPLRLADLAALGAAGWMALRRPLHPAARFAWLRTPARTIWQAHLDPAGFDSLAPEWRAEGILFTRPGSEVAAIAIDAPAHRLLAGLRLGESVRESAAAVARLYPDNDFALLFANLVAGGAFARPDQLERT